MRVYHLLPTAWAVLLAAAPLTAQQHQHNQPTTQKPDMAAMMCGGGMSAMMGMPGMAMPGMRMDSSKPGMRMGDMSMMSMMGPPGPAMILQQKGKLKLSAEQIARLESLQKQAQPECAHHMQAAMTAHQAANQLLDAATPDFAAFEAKLKEASAHMAEGHVVMAKAAVAARDLLTPAQRQALKNQTGMMHNMH